MCECAPAEEAEGETVAIMTVRADLRVNESFSTSVSLDALPREGGREGRRGFRGCDDILNVTVCEVTYR